MTSPPGSGSAWWPRVAKYAAATAVVGGLLLGLRASLGHSKTVEARETAERLQAATSMSTEAAGRVASDDELARAADLTMELLEVAPDQAREVLQQLAVVSAALHKAYSGASGREISSGRDAERKFSSERGTEREFRSEGHVASGSRSPRGADAAATAAPAAGPLLSAPLAFAQASVPLRAACNELHHAAYVLGGELMGSQAAEVRDIVHDWLDAAQTNLSIDAADAAPRVYSTWTDGAASTQVRRGGAKGGDGGVAATTVP